MKKESGQEENLVKSWLDDYPKKAADQILSEKQLPDPDVLWEKAFMPSKRNPRIYKKVLWPIIAAKFFGIAIVVAIVSSFIDVFFKAIEMFVTLNPLAILTLFCIFIYMLLTDRGSHLNIRQFEAENQGNN